MRNFVVKPLGSCMSEGFGFLSDGACVEADDGRQLFVFYLDKEGALEIAATGYVKHEGVIYDTPLMVEPMATNRIRIKRRPM